MNKSFNPQTPRLIGSAVVTSVILVAIYTLIIQPNKDVETTESTSTATGTNASVVERVADTVTQDKTSSASASNAPTKSTPDNTKQSSGYKDGTYKVTTSYSVPRGEQNSLTVSLTIKNGTVAALSTDSQYQDDESSRYVNGFENSIQSVVVGKQINGLSIGRVGGASYTSAAFKNVLADIVAEAQV